MFDSTLAVSSLILGRYIFFASLSLYSKNLQFLMPVRVSTLGLAVGGKRTDMAQQGIYTYAECVVYITKN